MGENFRNIVSENVLPREHQIMYYELIKSKIEKTKNGIKALNTIDSENIMKLTVSKQSNFLMDNILHSDFMKPYTIQEGDNNEAKSKDIKLRCSIECLDKIPLAEIMVIVALIEPMPYINKGYMMETTYFQPKYPYLNIDIKDNRLVITLKYRKQYVDLYTGFKNGVKETYDRTHRKKELIIFGFDIDEKTNTIKSEDILKEMIIKRGNIFRLEQSLEILDILIKYTAPYFREAWRLPGYSHKYISKKTYEVDILKQLRYITGKIDSKLRTIKGHTFYISEKTIKNIEGLAYKVKDISENNIQLKDKINSSLLKILLPDFITNADIRNKITKDIRSIYNERNLTYDHSLEFYNLKKAERNNETYAQGYDLKYDNFENINEKLLESTGSTLKCLATPVRSGLLLEVNNIKENITYKYNRNTGELENKGASNASTDSMYNSSNDFH